MENSLTVIGREDQMNRGPLDKASLVAERVDVDVLRNNFVNFMASLQSIVESVPPATHPFELKEIQFSAEISASGDFKLLGTGMGIQAGSAVTFILQRKE